MIKSNLVLSRSDSMIDEGRQIEDEREKEIFIVDRDRLIRTYISNFVKLYFDEAILRFPSSVIIKL